MFGNMWYKYLEAKLVKVIAHSFKIISSSKCNKGCVWVFQHYFKTTAEAARVPVVVSRNNKREQGHQE